MENFGLCSSMLSRFYDDLRLQDTSSRRIELSPLLTRTDSIFQGLDLDGPQYSAVDGDIVKQFKELIFQYPTTFLLAGNPLRAVKGFEHRIDTGDALPFTVTHKEKPS